MIICCSSVMSIVVCIFGKMARPRHTTHVRLVIRQRAITAAIAVSRGLEGPRQRGVSSRRIATLIQSMAKAIGGPRPQIALGALRRWRHRFHHHCSYSSRAAARWRPMVMPLKPSRLAILAMVRPCWRRRIAWARSSSVNRWLRSSPACPRSR